MLTGIPKNARQVSRHRSRLSLRISNSSLLDAGTRSLANIQPLFSASSDGVLNARNGDFEIVTP